jgi:signal transduction histidine kinase
MRSSDAPLTSETALVINVTRPNLLLRLTQIAWVGYAGLTAVLTLVGLPLVFAQLQTACLGSSCAGWQITPQTLVSLQTLGLSTVAYAWLGISQRILFALGIYGLAALLIWRRPDNWAALFMAYSLPAWATLLSDSPQALVRLYPALSAAINILWFIFFGFFTSLLLFPSGQWLPRWSRWVALILTARNLLLLFPEFLASRSALSLIWAISDPASLILILALQIYRYRRTVNVMQRQQTKWVLYSLSFVVLAALSIPVLSILVPDRMQPGSLLNLTLNWLGTCAVLFWLASFVIAILRYQLFNIDLLINRTLVYGALTAFVVGAYTLVVGIVGAWLHLEGNGLLSLVVVGLIAVAFNPLHQWLQRGVNRLMYGERDDPYTVIAHLGQRLEATFEPSALLPNIVETLAKTLNLPYVALATLENGELSIKSEWQAPEIMPTALATLTVFPLIYQNDTLGELRVSPRRGETALAEADRRLLADLALQASVAVRGVRLMHDLHSLTIDLQASRERLVLAREEERRRLRRDLHDDLAPTLAGLALTASSVTELIPSDPAKAMELANDLNQSIRAAVGNIRRLVYDLRPPTLDELGLVSAIRERAAQFTQSGNGLRAVVEADELPPLPAAVEVAAYRIAQEGLMNVVRHAQAQACHIRLALSDDCLQLEITDDGPGFSEVYTPGVGLRSMQERAAQLGGTCVIEQALKGGTRVQVRLPISKVGAHEPTQDFDR